MTLANASTPPSGAHFDSFAPVALGDLDAVRLMNRVDTKYVLPEAELPRLLARILPEYSALQIEPSTPGTGYETVYFDDAWDSAYHSHRRGKPNRFKVRTRTYLSSGDTFLEVKHRQRSGRSYKERIALTDARCLKSPQVQQWLAPRHPLGPLSPKLAVRFHRVTLVDHSRTERVTLDLGLNFRGAQECSNNAASNTVIIEVKQSAFQPGSAMVRALREHGIRPTSFSKYCVGRALSTPELKTNRFKATLRALLSTQPSA